MNAYGVYGKTVQKTLFEGDEKKRYIHIYHSISKDADERESFENALRERTIRRRNLTFSEDLSGDSSFPNWKYIRYR